MLYFIDHAFVMRRGKAGGGLPQTPVAHARECK
jgi:hypothetical protein